MTSDAINIHVQVFGWTFLLGRFLGVEFLIHIMSVKFLKKLPNFSKEAI